MVTKLLRLVGDSNEKQVKRLQWVVKAVNSLESSYAALSDSELRGKTLEFQEQLTGGADIAELLPDAFASVREAAQRTIGMRHFDVQLIGGMVLHQGKAAEMKTGEGKTLVATLPLYLNALEQKGAHLITVNDYLARRDTSWMGPVYHALGLTVGCLQHEESFIFDPQAVARTDAKYDKLSPATRKEAYAADITYGTNNEFGFDYLRDNMVMDMEHRVQRPLHYSIVDEVDSILIDEARTPLIISGQAQESTKVYQTFAQLAPRLTLELDYKIEEKERTVVLTEEGINKIERLLNIDNLYDSANYVLTHYVENALRAKAIYLRDKDYVVREGEVVIVDEFTGRLMEGRRYADGMHQALEAKEKVQIHQESVTYATITLQNYFRLYKTLAGMTGTAMTEAEELYKVYKLDVIAVPTHAPIIRQDLPDFIYQTEEAKYKAVTEQIVDLHNQGRPVLVGTVSIERSEYLSQLLHHRGIPHEVLNAKQHEREAVIVAQAGSPSAVTVATNMAGRGTDIILGGDPRASQSVDDWQRDHDAVVAMNGLFIIGTERHESRRIDNQLRGRSGRQGDPGTTRFFGSLEDEIMRRFGGDRIKTLMGWVGLSEDVPLESRMVSRVVDSTQSKVEAHNFDIRKQLVEYDDVVNAQRAIIYDERMEIMAGVNLRENLLHTIDDEVSALIGSHLSQDSEDRDHDAFLAELTAIYPIPPHLTGDYLDGLNINEIEAELAGFAKGLYAQREQDLGEASMRRLERAIMLQTIDRLWVQHVTAMQNLRQGIGLYAYGQRDPLVMYKKEGHAQFTELLGRFRHDIAHTLFHVVPTNQARAQRLVGGPSVDQGRAAKPVVGDAIGNNSSTISSTATRSHKVGRNDLCPCGSGKKYKRCHGVNR